MSLQRRAAILARTELFRDADEATRLRIAERAFPKVLERGQFVFLQGMPSNEMFVLARGAVKVYVTSRGGDVVELVRHHGPTAIGIVGLLNGNPHSTTAEALERSTFLVIPWTDLLQLVRSEAQVAEAMARALGAIAHRMTQQVIDLAFLDLPGRLARQLQCSRSST